MGDFTFYGDESYGEADAYAVAGYLASVAQWEKFNDAWRRFAKDEGFTVLHKRLLEHNRKGSKANTEFVWADLNAEEKAEKRKRINARACRIILAHALGGVGHAVQKSEWQRSISDHGAKWPSVLGRSVYAAGVFGCLNLAADLMEKKRRTGMIRYVFEDGADGRGGAEAMIEELSANRRTRDKFRIAGYSFESKTDPAFIPLQAADFLAYESYRQLDNQAFGVKLDSRGNIINPRGAFRCLVRADDPAYKGVDPYEMPCAHKGAWFDSAKIRAMVADIGRLLGTHDLAEP
jgi:hypothetical protein